MKVSLITRLEQASWGILLLSTAGSFFWFGRDISLAVAVGGIFALLNFRYMQRFCSKLIGSGGPPKKMAVQMMVKGAFPLFGIATALGIMRLNPFGFLLGLSSYVIAIMAYAAFLTFKALFFPDSDLEEKDDGQ